MSSTRSASSTRSHRRHSSVSKLGKGPDIYVLELENTAPRPSTRTSLPSNIKHKTKTAKPSRLHLNISEETKEKHARRALKYGNRIQHGVENTALVRAWAGGLTLGTVVAICGSGREEMWRTGAFFGSALIGASAYAFGSTVGLVAGGPVAAIASKRWLKKHGKECEEYDWPLRPDPPMEKNLPGKSWKYGIPESMHRGDPGSSSEDRRKNRTGLTVENH